MSSVESPWSSARGGASFAATVVLVLGSTILGGCTDDTCTPTDGDNTVAGPALECAAGEVCYLGHCLTTCNAGAELADDCTADDECGGARPNCVRGFCSSCAELQTCVPTLNICRSVVDVPLPERRERPDSPQNIPRPLDAGFVAGGIRKPIRDAGVVDQPVDREVTRAVFIDLGRQFNFSPVPGREVPVADVYAYDTAIGAGLGLKWRAEVVPPKIEVAFPDPAQDPMAPTDTIDEFCELRRLVTPMGPGGPPTPANIGQITVGNPADFPNSINPELTAAFTGTRYVVTPTVTAAFLRFSVSEPTQPQFVFVSGESLPGVISTAWPEIADFGHHVPFRLVPSPQTQAAMQDGFIVANPANEDLVFRYQRIETGNDSFEAIFVRITGDRTELFCEQREGLGFGGELRVRAAILSAFRREEGLLGQRQYDLFFERASREDIQPNSPATALVRITVRVRHSLRTTIRFLE